MGVNISKDFINIETVNIDESLWVWLDGLLNKEIVEDLINERIENDFYINKVELKKNFNSYCVRNDLSLTLNFIDGFVPITACFLTGLSGGVLGSGVYDTFALALGLALAFGFGFDVKLFFDFFAGLSIDLNFSICSIINFSGLLDLRRSSLICLNIFGASLTP